MSSAVNLDNQVDPNPHAVIVCNDLEKYADFAALLEKNGYPTRTVQNVPEEEPRPGTVYFVSFNLQSTNALFLAKQIESRGMICIVFAEEPGVQTAAKLSSAKMTQTLQHPYTQKNFVMAVQTIVKNRKAQFDKDLRKKQHDERLKAQQKVSGPAANAGIIIQEGAKQVTDDSAKVFKGDASENFSATQSGRSFKGFFAKQDSAEQVTEKSTMVFKADSKEKVTIVHAGQTTKGFFAIQENAKPASTKEKTEHESVTLDYSKLKEKPAAPVLRPKGPAPEAEQTLAEVIPLPTKSNPELGGVKTTAPAFERPMSHFWAVLIMVLLGSAICLFCVYQILLG